VAGTTHGGLGSIWVRGGARGFQRRGEWGCGAFAKCGGGGTLRDVHVPLNVCRGLLDGC
jgi:hypothetical protein